MAKAKITNVENQEPILTVDLGNGKTVRGTHTQLTAAVKLAQLAQEHGITKDEMLTMICRAHPSAAEELKKMGVQISINGGKYMDPTSQECQDGIKATMAAGMGHNSGEKEPADVSGKRLKSFIERIERLEEEKAGLAEDIKEVYAEAKGTGFEPRIMRKLIKLRGMDIEKGREEDELLQVYKAAIGME